MKPLTIEQLKALEVGDWVWIVDKEIINYTGYFKIIVIDSECSLFTQIYHNTVYRCSEYGTRWVAYKNKEQSEAKGEIVLPNGWLNTLKLLTCAAICYADTKSLIESQMNVSRDIAALYRRCPNIQGSPNLWALGQLADSNLNCNKIKGFEDVINAMPIWKELLKESGHEGNMDKNKDP